MVEKCIIFAAVINGRPIRIRKNMFRLNTIDAFSSEFKSATKSFAIRFKVSSDLQ